MLSNAYSLAKFRFDTAESEPAEELQKKCKKNRQQIAKKAAPRRPVRLRGLRARADGEPRRDARHRLPGRGRLGRRREDLGAHESSLEQVKVRSPEIQFKK